MSRNWAQEACAEHEARYKAAVVASTWGHLAPKPRHNLEADEPMCRAISEALESTAHITTYCLRDCDWRALGMTTQSDIDELYTTLRSTWVDHIERSIWKQIGN